MRQSRKELRVVGRLYVRDAEENTYEIVVREVFVESVQLDGTHHWIGTGSQRFFLPEGAELNKIDAETFEHSFTNERFWKAG